MINREGEEKVGIIECDVGCSGFSSILQDILRSRSITRMILQQRSNSRELRDRQSSWYHSHHRHDLYGLLVAVGHTVAVGIALVLLVDSSRLEVEDLVAGRPAEGIEGLLEDLLGSSLG